MFFKYLNIISRSQNLSSIFYFLAELRFIYCNRKVAIVNLDPANDTIPYPCQINIADLITLDDTMSELSLGPNGGIMFCLEYLLENLDWLTERLEKLQGILIYEEKK